MSEEELKPRGRKQKKPRSGVVVPKAISGKSRVLAAILVAAVKSLTFTWRLRLHDKADILRSLPDEAAIFSVWHNRLLMLPGLFQNYWPTHRPGRKGSALISASKDGAFLAYVMNRFGIEPVRGSASKRGARAMLELVRMTKRGYDMGITPDGPRGPRYEPNPGIIALAQLSGAPIVPLSSHVKWKVCMKSWDRFQIPLPFASVEVRIGRPIYVRRDTDDEGKERLLAELTAAMTAITED